MSFNRVQEVSKGLQEVQVGSRRFKYAIEGSKRLKKVQEGSPIKGARMLKKVLNGQGLTFPVHCKCWPDFGCRTHFPILSNGVYNQFIFLFKSLVEVNQAI